MNSELPVEQMERQAILIDVDQIRMKPLKIDEALEDWEFLAPFIERVFERSAGRIGIEGTLKAVMDGLAEVIAIWDRGSGRIYAVIVAEGKEYPNRRVYSLGLCGGDDVYTWAPVVWPMLCDHARKHGFNQIEVVGRRGWKRFIPGAEEIATFYAMDLDTEEREDG